LRYTYDSVGNVLTIQDYLNGTDPTHPQTQTFQYDALDRLTNAAAAGGNGNYNEAYTYDPNTGNLASKGGASYSYGAQSTSCPGGALSKAHAVVTAGSNTYCYNIAGNMNKRVIAGTPTKTYNLSYDQENRLTSVYGDAAASFVYDGNGQRVKSTAGGVTTVYIGNYYEWTTTSTIKYYYAGPQRIAMRTGTDNPKWLLTDHLGSTSKVANYNGQEPPPQPVQLYMAFGETRYTSGTMPTRYQFTGQFNSPRSASTTTGRAGMIARLAVSRKRTRLSQIFTIRLIGIVTPMSGTTRSDI
jgi:hypothetical protein